MQVHLMNKDGTKHEFDVTGENQILQQPALASDAVILYNEKYYVFSYTCKGGGGITFVEAELVEIVPKIGGKG